MQDLPSKQNQAFVVNIQNAPSLLSKELMVNHSEQVLLGQRIRLMREFINDLPSSDPQYSMIAVAIDADQIELDELQLRANALLQKMEEL